MTVKGVIPKAFLEKYGYIGKRYLWSARILLGNVVLQFHKLWHDAALSKGLGAERLDSREMKIPPENPSKDQVYRNKQVETRL